LPLTILARNNSLNNDELNGMDYNRVRRMLKLNQIKKIGLYGSTLLFQTSFESYDIEQTNNRFVAIPNSVNPRVLKSTIC
jgi:hypothetical protein